MHAITGDGAVLGVTVAAGLVMLRLALMDGRLRLRWERRCVSCGTIVRSRVCPRCGSPRD